MLVGQPQRLGVAIYAVDMCNIIKVTLCAFILALVKETKVRWFELISNSRISYGDRQYRRYNECLKGRNSTGLERDIPQRMRYRPVQQPRRFQFVKKLRTPRIPRPCPECWTLF